MTLSQRQFVKGLSALAKFFRHSTLPFFTTAAVIAAATDAMSNLEITLHPQERKTT